MNELVKFKELITLKSFTRYKMGFVVYLMALYNFYQKLTIKERTPSSLYVAFLGIILIPFFVSQAYYKKYDKEKYKNLYIMEGKNNKVIAYISFLLFIILNVIMIFFLPGKIDIKYYYILSAFVIIVQVLLYRFIAFAINNILSHLWD